MSVYDIRRLGVGWASGQSRPCKASQAKASKTSQTSQTSQARAKRSKKRVALPSRRIHELHLGWVNYMHYIRYRASPRVQCVRHGVNLHGFLLRVEYFVLRSYIRKYREF